MTFRSIRSRITFLSCLCLLIMGTTIIVYAAFYVRSSAIRRANDEIRFIAQDRAEHVRDEFDTAMACLHTLAIILGKVKDPIEPMNIEREHVDTMLQAVLKQNKDAVGIYTCWEPNAFDYKDKFYENEPGHGKTGRFSPYWYRNRYGLIDVEPLEHEDEGGVNSLGISHRDIRQAFVTDPHFHTVDGKKVLVVSLIVPILLKDNFYGIVGIDLGVESLQGFTDEAGIVEKGAQVIILSASGKIVGTTGRPDLAGEDATKIVEDIGQYNKEISIGKGFIGSFQNNLGFFSPIEITNSKPWWIIVSISRTTITAEATGLSRHLIFVGLCLILASMVIFWLFSNSIVKPLKSLMKGVKEIGRGNYGRVVEDVSSEDEIGELASAFNTMSLKINKRELERDKAENFLQESEARLAESNQLLAGVLEHTHMMAVFLDPRFNFIWVNRAYADTCKHGASFFPGKNHFDLYPHEKNQAIFQRVVDTGEPLFVMAKPFEFPDQPERDATYWDWSLIPVKDGTGKVTGLVFTLAEVTERIRAEEALRAVSQINENIIDSSPIGISIYNSAGNCVAANDAAAEIIGATKAQVLQQNYHQIDSWKKSGLYDVALCSMQEKAKKRHEIHVKTTFGKLCTLDIHLVPISIENESHLLIMSDDITKQKQAKEALRESEERYRSMMEAMKDLIYICSPDFRVEYMNPAMIRRTGRDATGEFCFKALHDLDEKCSWCVHDKVQQGEYVESEIVSPKDNRSYHISCSPIVHGDGSVSKMTVFRDTTDFRTLETQLQQAQKMEAIGTLAGGIAHDFNNILGGIMGYAELAKMKAPEGSEVIADLDKLLKSSNRATMLVKQILTVSRQHRQEQRPVQVRYIVNEALDLLRATLPTTIQIREDLAKDTGIVHADPTQIHQVIMNLGTNAGHVMREDGGVLEISLANVELDDLSASKYLDLTAGSYLRLTVRDTGQGMTSEIMERIFDPYFTTKDTGEGTGLGLSVAQGIVKAHGGTITVYSEPGKGTTFHVYLPVILEEEREEKESEEPLPTGNERILFIDDEQALVEIASQMLEQLRYEVVTKRSSVQALELFRTEPDRFDLVITDMTMPDMTGDKLAQELMKIRPNIPIILCTGHSRLVSEAKAREIGIRAFIMKPLVMRNLAETVRKVLDEK